MRGHVFSFTSGFDTVPFRHLHVSVTGNFVPGRIRTQENSYPKQMGTNSLVNSYPGTNYQENSYPTYYFYFYYILELPNCDTISIMHCREAIQRGCRRCMPGCWYPRLSLKQRTAIKQGCPTCRIVARSCDRRVKMCYKRFSSILEYPFFAHLRRNAPWQRQPRVNWKTYLTIIRCMVKTAQIRNGPDQNGPNRLPKRPNFFTT